MIPGATGPRPGRATNCAVVALVSSGATTGTVHDIEPAVGESFVVMFGQLASREHDSGFALLDQQNSDEVRAAAAVVGAPHPPDPPRV
jgi:hypothetical protein